METYLFSVIQFVDAYRRGVDNIDGQLKFPNSQPGSYEQRSDPTCKAYFCEQKSLTTKVVTYGDVMPKTGHTAVAGEREAPHGVKEVHYENINIVQSHASHVWYEKTIVNHGLQTSQKNASRSRFKLFL